MADVEFTNNGHMASIMKELSDIKSSLAVNTNETANIKGSIGEIKQDIKDIKNDTVNRREVAEFITNIKKEFTDADTIIKNEVAPLKKFVYGLIAITTTAILGGLLSLVLK